MAPPGGGPPPLSRSPGGWAPPVGNPGWGPPGAVNTGAINSGNIFTADIGRGVNGFAGGTAAAADAVGRYDFSKGMSSAGDLAK